MINKDKLAQVLAAYRQNFHRPNPEIGNKTHWEDEQYKWIAVKHFREHWDIEAADFAAMFKEATAKTFNLLVSQSSYPGPMIVKFAKADQEAVRNMCRQLYDERSSVVDRVDRFIAEAERLRKTYGDKEWGAHYQNVNSVSTYLWLKNPEKYYIYKYTEVKAVASTLESDYKVKYGAKANALLGFNSFYNEIAEFISRDRATTEMVRAALTPECDEDVAYHTLTVDVGYYISKRYNEEEVIVVPANPQDPVQGYWPSQEEYPLNLSKEDWKRFIEEVEFPHHKVCMQMLKGLLLLGGEATCAKLSQVYGEHATKYIGSAVNTGKRAKKYFNLPPCIDKEDNVERYFPIPYLGRRVVENGVSNYSYRLRPELQAALEEIDLSSINPYAGTADETDTPEIPAVAGNGYWWLNAKPKIWSFASIAVGSEVSYSLYNDNGN